MRKNNTSRKNVSYLDTYVYQNVWKIVKAILNNNSTLRSNHALSKLFKNLRKLSRCSRTVEQQCTTLPLSLNCFFNLEMNVVHSCVQPIGRKIKGVRGDEAWKAQSRFSSAERIARVSQSFVPVISTCFTRVATLVTPSLPLRSDRGPSRRLSPWKPLETSYTHCYRHSYKHPFCSKREFREGAFENRATGKNNGIDGAIVLTNTIAMPSCITNVWTYTILGALRNRFVTILGSLSR